MMDEKEWTIFIKEKLEKEIDNKRYEKQPRSRN